MADLGLVKRMVDDGWNRETAIEQIDALTDVIRSHLLDGKVVRLDGIGHLRAPAKVARAGFPPNSLREQRKVELRHGHVVEQGEPYPDPRAQTKSQSTYGR